MRLLLCLGLILSSALAAPAPELKPLVERAAREALSAHSSLRPELLALTLVDLRDPAHPQQASVRGDSMIYPASVIKLFFLAAAHRWMEDGKLVNTPELQRALRDMIVDSSNDATHYVIDQLTGTTSGPELREPDLRVWFERRNAVTDYFVSLGYTGVLAHKKPWSDGPYGRESQAVRLYEPRRNMLTTDATARLFVEIATGKCVSAARSGEMMALLSRDLTKKNDDPDDQAGFTGPALPPGAKLWSKAGWTSQARHDAAYIELPNGAKFVLVTFTEKNSKDTKIIQSVARTIVSGL